MRLTKAQRRILGRLRAAEDSVERHDEYSDAEIVCSGIECWIGLDRTSWRLVLALLRIMAISDRSDHANGIMGGDRDYRRFLINETGRMYLDDESQIDAVLTCLREQASFTLRDGKVVRL